MFFLDFHYYSIDTEQIQELFSTNIANAKGRKIGQITYNLRLYRAIGKEQ